MPVASLLTFASHPLLIALVFVFALGAALSVVVTTMV